MKIGEIILAEKEIILNGGKETTEMLVANTADRPIQVGSHFHFFEVNKQLKFDRQAAFGFRLDIPSGTSVRFEPGEEKTVSLVAFGGKRRIFGLNDLTCAQVSCSTRETSMEAARKRGFLPNS